MKKDVGFSRTEKKIKKIMAQGVIFNFVKISKHAHAHNEIKFLGFFWKNFLFLFFTGGRDFFWFGLVLIN